MFFLFFFFFFFQAEDGIRDFCLSRGLGDVYKRQSMAIAFVPEEKKPKRPRPKLKLVPEHGVTKVARPYQERLIQTVLTAFGDRVKEFLLAACPNAGKTFMSLEIAESMVVLGNLNRVLVLAHGTTVLRDQYRAGLRRSARTSK